MVPGADAAAGPPVRVSDDLVELLTVTQRRLARGVAAVLAEDGATLDGYRLLRSLAGAGGRSMGELVAALHLPAPTLTRLVDGAVDAALAYRLPDPAGRPEGRRPPVGAGPNPAGAAGGAGERARGGAGGLHRVPTGWRRSSGRSATSRPTTDRRRGSVLLESPAHVGRGGGLTSTRAGPGDPLRPGRLRTPRMTWIGIGTRPMPGSGQARPRPSTAGRTQAAAEVGYPSCDNRRA